MGLSWLPAELAGGPFSVSRARATALPPSRLRHPALTIPTRSVRAEGEATSVLERARAFLVALPDDVAFSHVTACQLWDLPLPGRLEAQTELDVMRSSSSTRVRRTGCHGHRGLQRRRTARSRGLPVTGLADTWVDLGEVAAPGLPLDELVILGDDIATRLDGPAEPGEADLFAGMKAQLEKVENGDPVLKERQATLSRQLSDEQARWVTFNAQLEELERLMAATKRR